MEMAFWDYSRKKRKERKKRSVQIQVEREMAFCIGYLERC